MATIKSVSIFKDLASDNELEDITKEEFEREFSKRKDKTVSIMCCGLTGTGKSTLLNGLLGHRLHHEYAVVNSLEHRTLKVKEEKFI